MVTRRHIARRVAATVMLAVLAAATAHADRRPDDGDAVAAFLAARAWIDAFDTPDPDHPDARLPVRHADAVAVLLRHRGRVVGAAVEGGGDDRMVRRAVGAALGRVLADPVVRELSAGPDGAAFRDGLGRQLTLELECAGPPVPLLGRTVERIVEPVEPGVDGLVVRRADRRAYALPARLLADNHADDLARQVLGLITELGFQATAAADLVARGEITCARCATLRLAQTTPTDLPFEASRTGAYVPDEAVTRDGVRAYAATLARHLVGRLWPDAGDGDARPPLGLRGDYDPVRDDYVPLVAPPVEQAMGAWALARFATMPGLAPADAADARAAAARILDDLAHTTDVEAPPLDDLATCAMIVLARTDLDAPVTPDAESLARDAITRVVDAFDARGDLREPTAITAHAMLVAAWCRVHRLAPERVDASAAARAQASLWAAWPARQQVGLLPWIAFADADRREASRRTGPPLAPDPMLRDLVTLVLRTQVVAAPGATSGADLDGGLVLGGRAGGRPTAQSVRPAAAIPAVLAADRPSGDEGPHGDLDEAADWRAHRRLVRFLMQITARPDTAAWMCRSPTRAIGGVQAAPWDRTQPVPAQALALAAAAETVRHWPGNDDPQKPD